MDLKIRPRRNRKSDSVRESLAETSLSLNKLIYPIFIAEDANLKQEIRTMPGQHRWGQKSGLSHLQDAWKAGLRQFAVFPVVPEAQKDKKASGATDPDHFLIRFFKDFKNALPEATLISDIALDPFNSDGHDGLVRDGLIVNDASVDVLAKMAVVHASAGVDWVAPSDMMDGRIGAVRKALDEAGHEDTSILAYSAKYASAFYGPFRDALDSAPRFGDKKTYQMDPRNSREALRETRLDIQQGADIVMVKPALAYLDVIQRVKRFSEVPVAAYNVSGEYAMIKLAAQAGALDEKRAALESLIAIRRAGADVILSYWAFQAADWL
ncbi:MAG: porphobilinogen synthase [Bdellovibrionaceae bacterium]|nr:porphobilinogen synthase [Pseudobdellovibrionaceae bacterium]MBX3034127.1 porphobilinogen synthase [Pseudobdellovibrionaceae bacterium]